MQNIPEEFKKIARSAELYDESEKIGEEFGLHIDQIGELDAEIRDVLEGASPASDFTKNIARRLEIEKELAQKVTDKVNSQVFAAIRKRLTDSTSNPSVSSNISSLEQIGGFNIEKERYDETELSSLSDRTPEKSAILAGIEDPEPAPETRTPKFSSSAETHTDPLADHLLAQPTATPEHKVVQAPANLPTGDAAQALVEQAAPRPASKSAPQPRTGPDPYRESVE